MQYCWKSDSNEGEMQVKHEADNMHMAIWGPI